MAFKMKGFPTQKGSGLYKSALHQNDNDKKEAETKKNIAMKNRMDEIEDKLGTFHGPNNPRSAPPNPDLSDAERKALKEELAKIYKLIEN